MRSALPLVGQIVAIRRQISSASLQKMSRSGVVLGTYVAKKSKEGECESTDAANAAISEDLLTRSALQFNDRVKGKLLEQLNCSEPVKKGSSRILYGLDKEFSAVSVVGIGERDKGIDLKEAWHEGRENLRRSIAHLSLISEGVLGLRSVGVTKIFVDPCGYADAAAEGANLSIFAYDELKSKAEDRVKPVDLQLFDIESNEKVKADWQRGLLLAEGQNLARRLMEIPANLLYPTRFAEEAEKILKPFANVTVTARDAKWAEEKKMFAFLSVNQGSTQPPVFLEIRAAATAKSASGEPPIVLVGKGVCFDSGGISLKPSSNMDHMRADMGGAANVLAVLYTLLRLEVQLDRDIIVLIPLVLNMPGGSASKPGDIVVAMNGKSIKIDNTDAEGRLILADALCYADTFNPQHVIDMATLTGAIGVALGKAAAGVFTNSDELWQNLHDASVNTGDRVWRMPLFELYRKNMNTDYADLNNVTTEGGGSCNAAAFLKEFTQCSSWAHIDIAGVMREDGSITSYLRKGMTGRPCRTIVELLERILQSKKVEQ